MKLLAICLCLLLHISCQESGQSLDKELTVKENKNKISPQQMKYINPEEVKNWSLEKIKEKYIPSKEEDFLLNDAIISEFRIGLYNFFDEEERNKPILIKEITWETDKDTNYTIWYKKESNQWIFVDSFIWNNGAVF